MELAFGLTHTLNRASWLAIVHQWVSEAGGWVVSRIISWFSSGAASAVMAKLCPEAEPVNCDLGASEDEDNERFLVDCEKWLGKTITRISSVDYLTIDEVFEDKRFMSGFHGAPCTREMKRVPRLAFQQPGDVHLFGYTADLLDTKRAEKFKANSPGLLIRFPLIERGLTKAACFALLEQEGIKRPRVYDMGYPNGNCPGCVKATSPDYWALVRLRHPEVFARRADQCRRLGVRLAIVGREKDEDGKDKNIRAFIDDIPADQPILNPLVPSCDFLCHLSGLDLAA